MPPACSETSVFSCPRTQGSWLSGFGPRSGLTPSAPQFSSLWTLTELHHQLPWFSSLQTAAYGTPEPISIVHLLFSPPRWFHCLEDSNAPSQTTPSQTAVQPVTAHPSVHLQLQHQPPSESDPRIELSLHTQFYCEIFSFLCSY